MTTKLKLVLILIFSTTLLSGANADQSATAPENAKRQNQNPYLEGYLKLSPLKTEGVEIFPNLQDILAQPPSLIQLINKISPGISSAKLLPTIKTVYPTGSKPLVVVSFKCPIEMTGLSLPPTQILHYGLTAGMDGLNYLNVFSFDLQQTCE